MSKGIAQLGPDGYIRVDRSPSDILQLELAHIFESDKSQSTLWNGLVSSMQWTIKDFSHSPEELASEVKRLLDKVFKPYFDNLETNAYVKDTEESQYTLSIYVRATVDGISYELGREMVVNPTEGTSSMLSSINR